MNKVFIQSNNSQILGAILAKYAIIRKNKKKDVEVEILLVDELEMFKEFDGVEFIRKQGDVRKFDMSDLQSFTLTRFMPPEQMNYTGKAVVIDPDIFTIVDIDELFSIDLKGNAIAACEKNGSWDTSVMLLDCSKLKHWKVKDMLSDLREKKTDYITIMQLLKEQSVIDIPRIWNSLDELNSNTKLLHTTMRLTQPWKTGLPIEFTINPLPKVFGIIPREPIYKLIGKYPTHYKKHPSKEVESFFLELLKDALDDGAVSRDLLQSEVDKKHIRQDIFDVI